MHAGDDLDQRRFAGAVLAEQRMDLARAHVEVDVLERSDAGERLGDAGHGDDGGRGRILVSQACSSPDQPACSPRRRKPID